ncbi:amidase signature enzyme [Thozetella sp. PMI_491]|nr:amidase signature enzyme [Thozetella sp. PMI_491]
MALSREVTLSIAENLSFQIPEDEVDEYTLLLERMEKNIAVVSAMEDYQPRPDLAKTPRKNLHLPTAEDNHLGAWAWRFELSSSAPSRTLLQGKTLCIKDNICVADVPCLLGTDTFQDWIPQTDATIVTRILDAGGVISGKAVCENLSRGAVSATAATGPVHNPYARGYSVGGSSSGTASLVASGATDMGIGCDQGGSIRIPAALAGLYGFKATLGLVPYTGIASNDASLDYVGPITTTCLDTAVLLEAIAGADGLDDRQGAGIPFPSGVPSYSKLLLDSANEGIRGMRIGILKEGLPSSTYSNLESKFRDAAAVFERLGASVHEISIPLHADAKTLYTVLSKMGNHMGMLGKATGRRQVMLTDLYEKKNTPYSAAVIDKATSYPVPKEGLLSGEHAWQRYPCVYPKAVNLSRKLRDLYDEALTSVDVLVMPTTLDVARPLPPSNATPVQQIDTVVGMTDNTCPFNASGHPSLAMPIGFVPAKGDTEVKVPASMQIVGKFHDELTIMKIAYAWEQEINWKEF